MKIKENKLTGFVPAALVGMFMGAAGMAPAMAATGEQIFQQAEVLWNNDKKDEAVEKYSQAKDMEISDFLKSEALWKMAEYYRDNEDNMLALHYGRQSAELLPDSSVRNTQMAYLAMATDNDREATVYFEKAFAIQEPGPDETFVLLDTTYAYKRLGEKEKVLDYLEMVIDKYDANRDYGQPMSQKDVETSYNMRREHAELTRKFGANTGVFYVLNDDSKHILQAIQELYWQPYYNNGRRIQVYGQLGTTLSATDIIPNGFLSRYDTTYANLGVRVEPLSEYNLVLAVERVFKIGDNTENDTRARAAYSWNRGLELQPYINNWQYATLYTEYLYFIEGERSLFLGEARYGRNFKFNSISERFVMSPHAFFGWDYSSRVYGDNDKWTAHLGYGINFRYWYRESKYDAPQSYLDVVFQYRFGLTEKSDNAFLITLSNTF